MKMIWKINLALTVLAASLYVADECLERKLILGNRCSAEKMIGREERELFDNQPIIPDRVDMLPLEHIARYTYGNVKSVWRRDYPHVEVVAKDGVICACRVGDTRAGDLSLLDPGRNLFLLEKNLHERQQSAAKAEPKGADDMRQK